jgi:glycosyltransferase involved in cell wall biosynthesis
MSDKTATQNNPSFQTELNNHLQTFLKTQEARFPREECLKIDLHCHDHNSDVPDELIGRILNVPETWLKTKKLVEILAKNKVDLITITNHNNARSCWELQDKGYDVLVGTEFSCMVPDFGIGIHVLAYGFNPEQEQILNKCRKNIYSFQQYAVENKIPTIWAHPLYHYKGDGKVNPEFFNKMAVIFERFEMLNGQRDTWQNLLVNQWVKSLTPEILDTYAERYRLDPFKYSLNPYKKSISGGSDSHMGTFAGHTGTYLHVPNLAERAKTTKLSELGLEALRMGSMAPYGIHQNTEKLTIAFLDYVCQVAQNMKDPGLMRILLHKGDTNDKILSLLTSNAFSELQKHKVTMRFMEMFHDCFLGKTPSRAKRLMVPKAYKPVFDDAINIAKAHRLPPNEMIQEMSQSVNAINNKLNTILFSRLTSKIEKIVQDESFQNITIDQIIDKFDIPSDFRSLFDGSKSSSGKNKRLSPVNLQEFLDGLSFPFLASGIILASNFTSAKVLYNNREMLRDFSEKLGTLKHPKRMLWLTDTYDDKNGVSMVLQEMHREIKQRNLPIDIMVCSNTVKSDRNLIVVKPLLDITLPFYKEQSVRIPDFVEVQRLFLEGGYDRIICSTEGVNGFAGLYLKHAYNVKAHFYIHTDWLMYARKALNLERSNLNRLRRILRAFYRSFDSVFVLNTDQQKWLRSTEMGLTENQVHLTAHWVDAIFSPQKVTKQEMFGLPEQTPVLLYSGRLSPEKGVMEIPAIVNEVKKKHPDVKIVFAGTGPSESELKKILPDAKFLGWVNHSDLPKIYSAADLLLLPSKFDTFSCAVLEAHSCGLPVASYSSKGPKDIILHNKSGFLSCHQEEMAEQITQYLNNQQWHSAFRFAAIERSKDYGVDKILNRFLIDVELKEPVNVESMHDIAKQLPELFSDNQMNFNIFATVEY